MAVALSRSKSDLYCSQHKLTGIDSFGWKPLRFYPNSPYTRVIAMARVAIENADDGNVLEIGKLDQHSKRLPGTVTSVPLI